MTNSLLGTLPDKDEKVCRDPCTVLCGDLGCCKKFGRGLASPHVMPARVLLCLLFPGHVLFVFIIFSVKIMDTPSVLFMGFYLLAATLQVAILLYLAQLIVYWMWKRGTDPDNAAIPYLTAIGDLVGTSLLAVAFILLEVMGDQSLVDLPAHGHPAVGHNVTEALNATI